MTTNPTKAELLADAQALDERRAKADEKLAKQGRELPSSPLEAIVHILAKHEARRLRREAEESVDGS